MIHYVNQNFSKHIITLEDPIEFVHSHQKSIINQREVGFDTNSFSQWLRGKALRQDPDIILVGEMRDLETIATAITAAETGHLCARDITYSWEPPKTIDRIIDVFPPHQQATNPDTTGQYVTRGYFPTIVPDKIKRTRSCGWQQK